MRSELNRLGRKRGRPGELTGVDVQECVINVGVVLDVVIRLQVRHQHGARIGHYGGRAAVTVYVVREAHRGRPFEAATREHAPDCEVDLRGVPGALFPGRHHARCRAADEARTRHQAQARSGCNGNDLRSHPIGAIVIRVPYLAVAIPQHVAHAVRIGGERGFGVIGVWWRRVLSEESKTRLVGVGHHDGRRGEIAEAVVVLVEGLVEEIDVVGAGQEIADREGAALVCSADAAEHAASAFHAAIYPDTAAGERLAGLRVEHRPRHLLGGQEGGVGGIQGSHDAAHVVLRRARLGQLAAQLIDDLDVLAPGRPEPRLDPRPQRRPVAVGDAGQTQTLFDQREIDRPVIVR